MPDRRRRWLWIVLVFEVVGVFAGLARAQWPLVTGEPLTMVTVPRDPRSMFRGNYVDLTYAVTSVPSTVAGTRSIQAHDVVYVTLGQDEEGQWTPVEVSRDRPSQGRFLRGRAERVWGGRLTVRYGIEAYFAPKERALEMERRMRNRCEYLAELRVASSGRAAIADVRPVDPECGVAPVQ